MTQTDPHRNLPATITDAQGLVWTYAPSPVEGPYARAYRCGRREAVLMAHQGSEVRRLRSTSGKTLARVDMRGEVLPHVLPLMQVGGAA